MKPDPKTYNPDPSYLNELIESTGMTQPQVADLLNTNERTVRRWQTGESRYPYPVQFALECLVLSVE